MMHFSPDSGGVQLNCVNLNCVQPLLSLARVADPLKSFRNFLSIRAKRNIFFFARYAAVHAGGAALPRAVEYRTCVRYLINIVLVVLLTSK